MFRSSLIKSKEMEIVHFVFKNYNRIYDKKIMNDKRCFLCKFQGVNNTETYSSEIYRSCGKAFELLLCYGHTIDLFRMGQVKFIQKHKPNFSDYFGLDDDQLIIRYLYGK